MTSTPDLSLEDKVSELIEFRRQVVESCRAVCHAAHTRISLEQVNSNLIHAMYEAMNRLEEVERVKLNFVTAPLSPLDALENLVVACQKRFDSMGALYMTAAMEKAEISLEAARELERK